jgi:hypothetical protein
MSDIEKLMEEELLQVAGGQKSDIQVAYEVIDGKYGNGQDRIKRLRAAGFDPNVIQPIVNHILEQQQQNQNQRWAKRDPYLG